MLIILEVVSALLVGLVRECLSYRFPVPAMLLQAVNEDFLLLGVPLYHPAVVGPLILALLLRLFAVFLVLHVCVLVCIARFNKNFAEARLHVLSAMLGVFLNIHKDSSFSGSIGHERGGALRDGL